ncbi:MAG: helix-turn-helix domain-containing protein [Desulfuromonadales bacterium]
MTKQERLRLLRLLSGQTQAGLAAAAGLKQSLITSYERGVCNISVAATTIMAPLLGVDPAYLTFGYPALAGKVWEPAREGKGLAADLAALLLPFCDENRFTTVSRRDYVDGAVFLLSADDGRHCLLFTASLTLTTAVTEALANLLAPEAGTPPLPCRFLYQFSVADFAAADLTDASFSWPKALGETRLTPELRLVLDIVASEVVPALVQGLMTHDATMSKKKVDEVSVCVAKEVRTQLEHAVTLLSTQGWSEQSQILVRQKIIAVILTATT